nr:tripartite tricarboxylate transporter substrate-binding protein [Sphaerotilus sp. FB-5]
MPQRCPGVPPLAERTLPGFEAATWYGLYAPKGTPREVIQKLHAAYLKALADKDWQKKMSDQGIHLLPEAQYAPEALARHTAAEVEKWRKVATDAKIQID